MYNDYDIVLQSEGNKINKNTANRLNEYWGTNYHARDIGRAPEELKSYNNLPNNHYGKIMLNGDYIGSDGINFGNIGDFL